MMSWISWPFRMLTFLVWYIGELATTHLEISRELLTPGFVMQPGVLAFDTRCRTDAEIMLFTFAVSLTPGTQTVAIHLRPNTVYVYAMYYPDPNALREELVTIESRLLRAMRRVDTEPVEEPA